MASDEPNYQPYVEEYHSDDQSDAVAFKGRKSPASPAVANVSTKRSHPSDLDKEPPPAQERANASDQRSDSGYSSITHATVGSADSAPSASQPRSPPVAAATTAPASPPAPPRRQPAHRQHSSRPEPLARTASQSRPSAPRRTTITQDPRRERRDSRVEPLECTEPGCTKCGPNALPPKALLQRRRPELQTATQSLRDVSKPAVDQRSMRSDPATYHQTSPPSPSYTRQNTYRQGPAVIQPSMPRRRSSVSRPMSYTGDPGAQYWVPGMPGMPPGYPSPPQERGPPPSSSAYRNPPHYNHPMGAPMPPQRTGYMPPPAQTPGFYPPYNHNQTSPPYEMQARPGMPSRNSTSSYGTRNGPAIVTQAPREPPKPSARRGPPQGAPQPRFPAPLQIGAEAYESSDYDSSSSEGEDEYEAPPPAPPPPRAPPALMPPPQMRRPKSNSISQRPPLQHAHTIQGPDVRERRRQSIVLTDRSGRERAPRDDEVQPVRTSRSRPAPPQRHTQSEYVTPRAQVTVNKSKTDRRRSGQVYEQTYADYAKERDRENAREAREARDARAQEEARAAREAAREAVREETRALEEEAKARQRKEARARVLEEQYQANLEADRRRQNRSSRIFSPPGAFDDDSEEEEEEEDDESEEEEEEYVAPPLATRRRRPTDVDSRKGKERVPETKSRRFTQAAEDYISVQRGSRDSYADQTYRAAKRASRIPSGPSEPGSSRSNGSDKQSQSNHTAVTNNGSNEIRLRVDASNPVSLSFNGDMEGRTLQLVPTGDGMADIVIGATRGGESIYRGSDRGSIMGNKRALVVNPRRDAEEEMTERSSRSGRSGREGREVRVARNDREGERHPLRRYRN